jgi:hypothetical protein
MANVNVDTTAPNYQARRADFLQLLAFWRPALNNYQTMSAEQQAAWRAADPGLNELLTFVEEVYEGRLDTE